MSFSVLWLFLILLQSRLTEQVTEGSTIQVTEGSTEQVTEGSTEQVTEGSTEQITEGPTEPSTHYTSFSSENTDSTPFTKPTPDSTIYGSSTNSGNTQINLSTKLTTEGTTEDSNSYLKNTQTPSSTETTTELTTEDSNTISTVATKFKPIIQSRALPDDVSIKSENKISNEQTISYEKNFSSASVLGIVLGSIISTVAVFYITVSLITKYRRKSYAVRSPSIELGQA